MSAIIINVFVLAIFIAVLSLSTYGLGKNDQDKMSTAYQAASAFTMISVSGTIISLIILIILVLNNKEEIVNRFSSVTKGQ